MATPSFHQRRVLSFESRLAAETASLIEKYGGRPLQAPCMQEVPLDEHSSVFSFAEKLMAGEIDVVICLTGVGTRMMIETMSTRFERDGLIAALNNIPLVSRGPKPVRALREYGLTRSIKVPEPNTWHEVLETIDGSSVLQPLEGKCVAVQEYGKSNPELIAGLEHRGAIVEQVSIYRWSLPEDVGPLRNAIATLINGDIDIVVFTSRTQIDHVMAFAASQGLSDALLKAFSATSIASIGPVCTEGLLEHGIEPTFEPTRPKLGVLMRELASA
jgi:uroporphyrinogen-III synthase